MPFTADMCEISGIYKIVHHILHQHAIPMKKGHPFPSCRECHKMVEYKLVEPTQDLNDDPADN